MPDVKRKWLLTVGLGAVAAGFWLVGVGLPYLTPLPIFFSAAAFGLNHAAVAAIAAALIVSVGTPGIGIRFAVGMVLPCLILARQALLFRSDETGRAHWYPVSRLIGWLTAVAAVIFTGLLLLAMSVDSDLPSLIVQELLVPALNVAQPQIDRTFSDDDLYTFAQVIPATVAVSWMIVMAVNAIIAQALAAGRNINIRPDLQLGTDRIPVWIAGALFFAAVGSFALEGYGVFVCETFAAIFAFPFFLQGMSLIHRIFASKQAKRAILTVIYTVTTMLFGIFGPLIVVLGLLEQWAGWRRKLLPAGHN